MTPSPALMERAARRVLATAPTNGTTPSPATETSDEGFPANLAPTLHRGAYYGAVGEWVRLVEPETEAHPAGLMVALLVTLGAVVGRSVHTVIDGARHGVNNFAILVGGTSTGRKGTVIAHVRRALRELDEPFYLANRVTGLSSGEGLIYAIRDPIPPRETDKHPDRGVTDKRLLVIESEMAGPFKMAKREGNTLSPTLRVAWDGDILRSLTKNAPVSATDPHISILGAITPSELSRQLSAGELENGLINRFLLVHTERVRLLPHGGDVPELEERRILADLRERIAATALLTRPATFTAAGHAWWTEAYFRLTTGHTGRAGAATQRSAAHVRRVALLYAALDGTDAVDAVHLAAADHLVRYCTDTARHLFGRTALSALAERIGEALASAGTAGMDRTAIRRVAASNGIPGERIKAALEELQAAGLARCAKAPTAGRAREVWEHVTANLSPKYGIYGRKGSDDAETEGLPSHISHISAPRLTLAGTQLDVKV